ncbi:MAG: hypothetical protein J6D46_08685 [Lachnospiraceae bacterium]|nr:hypothetical protein [Lachnospiraceae bacterium]
MQNENQDQDSSACRVVVTSCPFSTLYSPFMCAFIGAMDDGIVSGIFGEGHFRFTGRITEGCGVCRASLVTGRGEETDHFV